MPKEFSLQLPNDEGLRLSMSGDEPAGIYVACEAGELSVTLTDEHGDEGFIIPANHSWTSLPLLRQGLKSVWLRRNPATGAPAAQPVVTFDIGRNAGIGRNSPLGSNRNGPATDGSADLGAGATAEDALAQNLVRHYLHVVNNHATEDLWINFGVDAIIGQPSVLVLPNGGSFTQEGNFVFTDRVSVIAATILHPFTVKEG